MHFVDAASFCLACFVIARVLFFGSLPKTIINDIHSSYFSVCNFMSTTNSVDEKIIAGTCDGLKCVNGKCYNGRCLLRFGSEHRKSRCILFVCHKFCSDGGDGGTNVLWSLPHLPKLLMVCSCGKAKNAISHFAPMDVLIEGVANLAAANAILILPGLIVASRWAHKPSPCSLWTSKILPRVSCHFFLNKKFSTYH